MGHYKNNPSNEIDITEYGNIIFRELKKINKKFRLACSQVVLLNNEIEYMQNRYDVAVSEDSHSFRYFLRLKISTLEGVRDMMYEYAGRRADQIDAMHEELLTEGIIDEELNFSDLEDDNWNISS